MLTDSLLEPALISLAYLLGSVPTALLVCNSMGIADPRQQGSGNPGATNVLRIGNPVAAALTFLGDSGKGALAVSLAIITDQPPGITGLCALAAVLGHLFPMFGAYRGGKGIATFFGCMLLLSWPLLLIQLSCWLILAGTTRIASLASVVMALITPLLAWWLTPELLSPLALIALLLIARHRLNLLRLFQGQESRF
ncbi:Acyl-phosphate:glycerol-3-phosphate O-acyltransferase PlsY [Nitrincola lacisaponensis]|uniref:Glycerol-3-phosphate acyltransferase n=1 Tax=Nitrincola lacisaponensis TaxID=267850 RepID=A0A063Y4Q1_9GAMM|nr:glycerol-3-phosphate 1-O-acyltransferase PlsY [Nitrincola lacisaponensis]KDE40654.1 Acyl-phosphate:glycerol-3-phosphate O-acyltransferase PlsY [Nitrincola lacisaponensis]